MHDHIENHQHEDYKNWLERKVEKSRVSMRAGKGRDDNQVETEFANLRHKSK